MAVLTIQDGNLEAFKNVYPHVPEQHDALLIEAAGRPGAVGRKMTLLLMRILKNELLTWLPQMTMDTLHVQAAHTVFLSTAIPLMNSTSVWLLKAIERHFKSNDMVNCGGCLSALPSECCW